MPFDNRGLLKRVPNGGIDPATGWPLSGPIQPQTKRPAPAPNMDMPWGDGTAFGELYNQKPKAPQAPQAPGQNSAFANIRAASPQWTPEPIREMGPPSAPQYPSMGQTEVGPNDASYAAYNPKPERQPQPGDQAMGEEEKQPDDGRILGFDSMEWIRMGMSMMGNAQNGGDWSKVGQDIGGLMQERKEEERYQRQDKRQTEQDAMQKEMHGYQVGDAKAGAAERERIDGVRKQTSAAAQQMLDAMPADADPAERSLVKLAVADPDKFANVLEYNLSLAKESRDEAREIKLLNLKGQIDQRVASARAATDQAGASAQLQKQMSGIDQRELAPMVTQAQQIRTRALPSLQALLDTLYEAKARGLEAGVIAPGADMKLKALFDRESRTLFDKWAGGSTLAAINALKGLGPMAAQELEATAKALGSPENTVDSAISQIEGVIAQNQGWADEVLRKQAYFDEAGGLMGPGVKNARGESLLQSEQRYLAENPGSSFSGAGTMSDSPQFKSLVADVSAPGYNRNQVLTELLKDYRESEARLILSQAERMAGKSSQPLNNRANNNRNTVRK